MEFHTLLTDMEKLTTSTSMITMRRHPQNIPCISMGIIFMDGNESVSPNWQLQMDD